MKRARSSLSDRVRWATKERHVALEQVPMFSALQAGELPRTSMVSYLRGLSIVHAVLETNFARRFGRSYGPWRAGSTRVEDLLATLEAAGATALPDVSRVLEAALTWADAVMLDSHRGPALLGAHYVLEGSQLGGRVLREHVAGALGIAPEQVTYFSGDGTAIDRRWAQYRVDLDALELDEGEQDTLIGAAQAAYAGVASIAAAAFPYREDELRLRVTAINPEAGRHAMPRSDVEVARALRCARVAWERFPYLADRFGERGRRFTNSDSCWLVSLYDEAPSDVTASLRWLRGVLASRGLPTVILEHHLEAIDRDVALDDAVRASAASGFRAAIEGFRAERAALIPTDVQAGILDRWQPRFDGSPGTRVEGAAELLIAARLDTAVGVAAAWESTRRWFVDPERFATTWIDAVDRLAEDLEGALGSATNRR